MSLRTSATNKRLTLWFVVAPVIAVVTFGRILGRVPLRVRREPGEAGLTD